MTKPVSSASRNVEQYRKLHESDKNYGKSSRKVIDLILLSIKIYQKKNPDQPIRSILDFGCGKSSTAPKIGGALGIAAYEYDPAIPGKDALPVLSADFVINTDVLEHLDIEEVDILLSDISQISKRVFFQIATAPAGKSLPNGENAHATVRPAMWWKSKLFEYFDTVMDLPAETNRATFVTWDMTEPELKRIHIAYNVRRKRYGKALKRLLGA